MEFLNLKIGDTGEEVAALQQWLNDNFDAGLNPDWFGTFGPLTEAAVNEVLTLIGQDPDGSMGAEAFAAAEAYLGTSEGTGGAGSGEDDVLVDDSPPPGAEFSSEEGEASYPGLMPGGQVTKVSRADNTDLWIVRYEWPPDSGSYLAWQFDSQEQIESVLGPEWFTQVPVSTIDEETFLATVSVMDSVDEIMGEDASFQSLMNETMEEAARTAGINDPSLIGMIVGNSEWQEIAAMAALGGWSEAQITAALRDTDLWTKTLYPGIDTFYGQTDEPEAMWASYADNVIPALQDLGYQPDDDGSYRTVIGDLLGDGVDDDAFVQSAATYLRAEGSPEYRAALNQWTTEELGEEMTFEAWFDVLAGQTSPEIADIVERANLQFAADRAGLDVAADLISSIASQLDISEAQAFNAFTSAEKALLSIGEANLNRYGLSQSDLVAASTGITPESGRSIGEIQNQARVAATEMGFIDDVENPFFVGFSERGTPTRPGLEALAPERG